MNDPFATVRDAQVERNAQRQAVEAVEAAEKEAKYRRRQVEDAENLGTVLERLGIKPESSLISGEITIGEYQIRLDMFRRYTNEVHVDCELTLLRRLPEREAAYCSGSLVTVQYSMRPTRLNGDWTAARAGFADAIDALDKSYESAMKYAHDEEADEAKIHATMQEQRKTPPSDAERVMAHVNGILDILNVRRRATDYEF